MLCRLMIIACTGCLVVLWAFDESASAAEPVLLSPARIETVGRKPVTLEGDGVPDYLSAATIYNRDKKPGEDPVTFGRTEFKVLSAGIVFIQAGFKSDGNASGGWKPEARTAEQLQADGWKLIGPCGWSKDDQLFARFCKAGEVLKIRTKKYAGPSPILAARPVAASLLGLPDPNAPAAAVAQDELVKLPSKEARTRDETAWLSLLQAGEYAELEQVIAGLRERQDRYRSGNSRALHFYQVLGSLPPTELVTDQAYLKHFGRLEAWLAAEPKSSAVRIALAVGWLEYGWFARGSGYADTVSDADAQRLNDRAEKANGYLDEVEKLSSPLDCGYYRARISVAIGLGNKPKMEWSRAGLKLDPLCREVVYSMSRALLPRWFGEPGELEGFAAEAAKWTQTVAGDLHFSTVAIVAWDSYREDMFAAHPLEWSRVLQGFRDRERIFPHAVEHRDVLAAMAVLAGDYATAREQFQRVGNNFEQSVWRTQAKFDDWKLHVAEDLQEGQQHHLVIAHEAAIVAMNLSPDGKTVVTTDLQGKLRIHELDTGKRRFALALDGTEPATVTISGKVSLLASALNGEPGIYLMNLVNGNSAILEQGRKLTKHIAFSPDGESLAAVDETGKMTLFKLSDGSILHDITPPMERSVSQLVYSPDGGRLATGSDAGQVQIHSTIDGKLLEEWSTGTARVLTIAWSQDGKRLAVADRESRVFVFDLPGHQQRAAWTAPHPFAETLDFSPDGNLLAIGLCGRQYNGRLDLPLRVWKFDTETEPQPLPGHKLGVRRVSFSANGKQLVSASYDWTVRVWNIPAE